MESRAGKGSIVYQGRTLSVRLDPVRVPAGQSVREVVERSPAVAVIAECQNRVAVIRQYRWAVDAWLIELPAGKVEPGEAVDHAARRELREETGILVDDLSLVFSFHPTPGYSNERVDLFFGRVSSVGPPLPDPDEDISLKWWNRNAVEEAVATGSVTNGIALLGLMWWLSKTHLDKSTLDE